MISLRRISVLAVYVDSDRWFVLASGFFAFVGGPLSFYSQEKNLFGKFRTSIGEICGESARKRCRKSSYEQKIAFGGACGALEQRIH